MSLPPPAEGDLAGSSSRGGAGGGGGVPLLLSRCVGSTGDIVEPLPLLLGCLHHMLVSGRESLAEHARSRSSGGDSLDTDVTLEEDSGDGAGQAGVAGDATAEALRATLDDLASDLRRLSAALATCPLEEFDLDKVTDFSPTGGPAARGKLTTAALLCGSYEALMQGSLLLSSAGGGGGKFPAPASVRGLLGLFDCRQTLLSMVRPSLPTAAQQRSKKGGTEAASGSSGGGSSGNSGSIGGGSFGDEGGAGGGAAMPGFSAAGCFGLTLHPGGMPCLGVTFVEDMLTVLNVDKPDDDEETEGDTERDPGLVDVDVDMAGGDPPTEVRAPGGEAPVGRAWIRLVSPFWAFGSELLLAVRESFFLWRVFYRWRISSAVLLDEKALCLRTRAGRVSQHQCTRPLFSESLEQSDARTPANTARRDPFFSVIGHRNHHPPSSVLSFCALPFVFSADPLCFSSRLPR